MERRNVLKGIAAGGALGALKPQPTFGATSKKYRFSMATTWPPKMPILQESADLFSKLVEEASDGRMKIKVYAGGELIPPLGVFDAVSQGSIQMGIGAPYYWAGKSQAFQFFSAIPFGFTTSQFYAWIEHGGGQVLWEELYRPFNLISFSIGNTGAQMGGWFKKPITGAKDLKGLKIRMPGFGGKVLGKAGANVVLMAGSEIYTALERGTIDATEWVSPFHDERLGLHRAAKYYYYPGWHEPCGNLEIMINLAVWNELPKDLQAIIRAAAAQTTTWCITKSAALNGPALKRIKTEHGVKVQAFPDEVLKLLKGYAEDVISELASKDPAAKKVYDSYKKFQRDLAAWTEVSDIAYSRALTL